MSALTPTTSKYPAHLEALFQKLDPPKARVIFAIDATASRQPTWDLASKLTSDMLKAVGGGLELQLVYYRGESECTASRWVSNPHELTSMMSRVMCAAGFTQIARVLAHVEKEDRRNKVAACILISDACEEHPSELYTAARRLNGAPVFMFQEGTDEKVSNIYGRLASITNGATCRFDAGAAARLADLLRAVAAFATGGVKALAAEKTEAARLLLSQIK